MLAIPSCLATTTPAGLQVGRSEDWKLSIGRVEASVRRVGQQGCSSRVCKDSRRPKFSQSAPYGSEYVNRTYFEGT